MSFSLSLLYAEPLVWFTSKFTLSAHSVWLATQWPSVMIEWQRVEQNFPTNPVQKRRNSPFTRIGLMVVVISVIIFSWVRQAVDLPFPGTQFNFLSKAFQCRFPSPLFFSHQKNSVEHTLSLSVSLFRSIACTNSTKFEAIVFYKQAWPQIYTIIKYDGGVRGFSGELLNYYCILQWVFMDILLIAITICLSTRLRQLNQHLKQYKGMVNFTI